ncbi:MAG: septum formation initiator family protein [Candidatus Kerfeldbacteria bacterium]|nr:septum formation initiator family protein [Candidatus Kerfeldbacteria bacterium]
MRFPSGWQDRLRGEWVLLVGVLLIVVFSIGVSRELLRRRAVADDIAALRAEVASLTSRRDELQRLIAEFQTATAQEREARTRLNLAHPGERALLIQQPTVNAITASEDDAAAVTSTANGSNPLPQRWWQYFFGT